MGYPSNIPGIIDNLLYDSRDSFEFDVYYTSEGHPRAIHDKFGASEIQLFSDELRKEIKKRNSAEKTWQFSAFGYGVESIQGNCGSFEMEYRGMVIPILMKTIEFKIKQAS